MAARIREKQAAKAETVIRNPLSCAGEWNPVAPGG
jgi:hypothetical protein